MRVPTASQTTLPKKPSKPTCLRFWWERFPNPAMWIITRSKSKMASSWFFRTLARELGSSLQPVVGIYDAETEPGARVRRRWRPRDKHVSPTEFSKAGTYYIRVSDYEEGGNGGHFYRIKVGRFPLAVSAFPLGLQKGKTAAIHLTGYNLGADKIASERRAVTGRHARGHFPAGDTERSGIQPREAGAGK